MFINVLEKCDAVILIFVQFNKYLLVTDRSSKLKGLEVM